MRRFRVYDNEKKRYVTEELDWVINSNGELGLLDDGDWSDCPSCIKEDETGLPDKNGKRIFEGDIVIADFDYNQLKMEVIFFKCGFKLKSKKCTETYDYSIHDETPRLMIIGNIHDNPELLEVEE